MPRIVFDKFKIISLDYKLSFKSGDTNYLTAKALVTWSKMTWELDDAADVYFGKGENSQKPETTRVAAFDKTEVLSKAKYLL